MEKSNKELYRKNYLWTGVAGFAGFSGFNFFATGNVASLFFFSFFGFFVFFIMRYLTKGTWDERLEANLKAARINGTMVTYFAITLMGTIPILVPVTQLFYVLGCGAAIFLALATWCASFVYYERRG